MDQHIQDQLQDSGKRKLIQGAVALTTAMASGIALAANHQHQPHQHHGMAANDLNHQLVESGTDCVKHSELCISHCIELFKQGDTTLARCAESVNDVLAVCNTLVRLASSNSPHLKSYAHVCIAVNRDCEKECRKHEKKHEMCKACADSCKHCIELCENLLAA